MKILNLAVVITLLAVRSLSGAEPANKNEAVAPPAGDELLTRMQSVLQQSLARGAENAAEALVYLEAETRKLQKEFPQRPEPYELLLSAATFSEATKARALAQEIVDSKVAAPELKAGAAGLLKNLDGLGKPLTLKFTSLDGRPVDLAMLQGKVVLIDCWATWCPPCIGMLPHLKATYQELKPRGFEIVGISFDDDKSRLTSFVKREEVSWPQHFDGKGRENQFAQEFGVQNLPTLWLVDKKGVLRYLNAGTDLRGKATKLLEE